MQNCESICVWAILGQNSYCVSLNSYSSNSPLDSHAFQIVHVWRMLNPNFFSLVWLIKLWLHLRIFIIFQTNCNHLMGFKTLIFKPYFHMRTRWLWELREPSSCFMFLTKFQGCLVWKKILWDWSWKSFLSEKISFKRGWFNVDFIPTHILIILG